VKKIVIFDMDGTLVQTEKLKALAYARAARALDPSVREVDVLAAFEQVVGLSRREVSQTLLARFNLEAPARARMAEFGVTRPWQAYTQIRLQLYQAMIAKPDVVRAHVWPHAMTALENARHSGCRIGLATMSYCPQVTRILRILELEGAFAFIATREDVARPKPDPEIYLLSADELGVPPGDCLVLEDSTAGVQAALAAGMHCVAVTTPLTRAGVHDRSGINPRWIVDQPSRLPEVLADALAEAA
jgi:HAD superfamily hydrolase (TIGR01509 family)